MTITCQDRERIFLDGSAEEWAALEQHATTCAECVEEVRAWRALSVAAEELRDHQENPALWQRIQRSLEEQGTREASFWARVKSWKPLSPGWQTALAGALALLVAIVGGYALLNRPSADPAAANKLLKNAALAEVERTEREYMKAIDRLATDARPQLDSPATPLAASYQEKLVVLDSAIQELKKEAEQNPSNAHLRYQLLAMYQEKQQTLQDVLEMKR